MKLGLLLWLSSMLPQPMADQVCLATTIYLEARSEPEAGQFAVAEVALRRRDSGRWGQNLCKVLRKPRQFALSLVSPRFVLKNPRAFARAFDIAGIAMRTWELPEGERSHAAPTADHFVDLDKVRPGWIQRASHVTRIGGHSFYLVTL